MKIIFQSMLMTLVVFLRAGSAFAAVTLLDKDEWKVSLYGFVESDLIQDSTRGFTEVIGNAPVARGGTLSGDNPQLQFSDRNSRLGFIFNAPTQDGWKSKGQLELDFLGYDPKVNTAEPKNSESGFYQNPTPRFRHAFMTTENENGWLFLTGQTWSLFGWQPYYFPTLITVAPEVGELYQRDLQTTAIKTITFAEKSKMQIGLSLERPSQRDSGVPDINFGLRYVLDSYRSAFASTTGDVKTEPLSIGLSSSFRQFETPSSMTTSPNRHDSSAYAVDFLIPIVGATDAKNPGNSLTLTGEYTVGTGYANSLPNWNGGLSGFPQGAAAIASNMTLDAGFGGFDSAGNFNLLRLETYNVSLQYQLPTNMHSYMNAGLSRIASNNVATQTASASSTTSIYDTSSMYFVNYLYDFTSQIRLAAEYSNQITHYVSDETTPSNNRYQLSAYFRF